MEKPSCLINAVTLQDMNLEKCKLEELDNTLYLRDGRR